MTPEEKERKEIVTKALRKAHKVASGLLGEQWSQWQAEEDDALGESDLSAENERDDPKEYDRDEQSGRSTHMRDEDWD